MTEFPRTPREGRYDWFGFAATDTLDEIERRIRNLMTPDRGWTMIQTGGGGWPSIATGLFLAGGMIPDVDRTAHGVYVRLTNAESFGVFTTWTTEAEAKAARYADDPRGPAQVSTFVEFQGGARAGDTGCADRISIERVYEHGHTERVHLAPQWTPPERVREHEARIIEAVAERLAVRADDAPVPPGYFVQQARAMAGRVREGHGSILDASTASTAP